MKRLLSTLLSFSVLCTSLTAVNTDDFALIPGGSFQMGDNLDGDSDAPVVTVNVSAFYMGKYEVTKAEWDEVRSWGLSNGYTDLASGGGKAADHPVHSINWYDIVKWCNARSEQEGRTPCYTVSGSIYRTGDSDVVCNWDANGYRLPTEAEWEKAARGGLSGQRFPWGDTISHANANYSESTSYDYDVGDGSGYHPDYSWGDYPYTSPVGSFAANGYGLYDNVGNVREWCWDRSISSYSDGAADPRGASSGSSRREIRGGTWRVDAYACRLANRNDGDPFGRSNNIGCRVAFSSVDADGDGLDDSVETNTGIYVSETDTGTDPNNPDTDGDGVEDFSEISDATDPNNPNLFLISAYPSTSYASKDYNTDNYLSPDWVYEPTNNRRVGRVPAGGSQAESTARPIFYFDVSSVATTTMSLRLYFRKFNVSDRTLNIYGFPSSGTVSAEDFTNTTKRIGFCNIDDSVTHSNENTEGTIEYIDISIDLGDIEADTYLGVLLTLDGEAQDGWIDVVNINRTAHLRPRLIAYSPVLALSAFYESNIGESITIDATPSNGYPTDYTYQWYLNSFPVPENFGGTASSYTINGTNGNNGTWKIEVTNDTDTTSAEFEYRVFTDSDSDGLSNYRESNITNTDPDLLDTDSDGLNDYAEVIDNLTDPNDSDSDDDGLSDGAEVISHLTDPNNSDSDEDGLSDGAEVNTHSTDPKDSDSDDDGLLDGAEVNIHLTNPNQSDTDSDNLSDADEINNHLTNPNNADTDGDGLNDGDEINTHSTDPLASDSSGDGLSDGFVASAGFAPNTDYSNLFTKDALNALGYYASSQLEDARTGAVMIEATGSTATLQLQIERSEDLTNWTQHEDDLISVPMQMDGDRQFFRFAMPQQ